MHTFGYLVVDQGPADLVTFPDGSSELHPPGDGGKVAGEWNAVRQASDAHDQAQVAGAGEPDEAAVHDKLEELIASWEAATQADLEQIERDTSSLGNPQSQRASYLRRHPRPTVEDARNALRRAAASGGRRPTPKAKADALDRCWWAGLESETHDFRKPIGGPGSIPRRAVANVLGELSRDGWNVRHVSEERAAVHGPEVSTTVCVGMNVMLSRRLGTERQGVRET